MGDEKPGTIGPDTIALLKAVADSPKRDNSAYHRAMAEARQAFEDAVSAIGAPIQLKTKIKKKPNGDHVVKWTFKSSSKPSGKSKPAK
jgi:hypothetical protein